MNDARILRGGSRPEPFHIEAFRTADHTLGLHTRSAETRQHIKLFLNLLPEYTKCWKAQTLKTRGESGLSRDPMLVNKIATNIAVMDHTLGEALAALTTTPHQSLKGKLITVTGAGSGIGRATAILLAGRGAILGLADIQEGPLKETADKITTSGGKAYTSIVNIADRSAVEAWISSLVKEAGKPLDGAVKYVQPIFFPCLIARSD